jgi:hypothetical protein
MHDQRLSGSAASVNNARCDRWLERNLQSSFSLRRTDITLLVRRHCDSLLGAVTIKGASVSPEYSGSERWMR